jgi:hypothetical protein
VNGYRVEAAEQGASWTVAIVNPAGERVFERVCGDEDEARALGSTVSQHLGWLSEERFRRYYRLP